MPFTRASLRSSRCAPSTVAAPLAWRCPTLAALFQLQFVFHLVRGRLAALLANRRESNSPHTHRIAVAVAVAAAWCLVLGALLFRCLLQLCILQQKCSKIMMKMK